MLLLVWESQETHICITDRHDMTFVFWYKINTVWHLGKTWTLLDSFGNETYRYDYFVSMPKAHRVARCVPFELLHYLGILCGSVVKCLTPNPGILGWSHTESSGSFMGVSLGKTLQSPSLVLVKLGKDMNNVSCLCDMTEIMLKVAQNIIQSIKFHYQTIQPHF